jgi:hypothetical protein
MLPIVHDGDCSEVIKASLVSSTLWKHFKVMRLSINMWLSRLSVSVESRLKLLSFARWVLDIGEGKVNCPFTLQDRLNIGVRIPSKFLVAGHGSKMEGLASDIYIQ